MISIKYEVTLTNPLSDKVEYSSTETLGNIFSTVSKHGLFIEGSIQEDENVVVASSQLVLGDKYSISSNNTLVEKSPSFCVDIEDIFKLNGKNIKDVDNKIMNCLKLFTIKDDYLYTDTCLFNAGDIIALEVDSNGFITLLTYEADYPTFAVKVSKQLDPSYMYLYITISSNNQIKEGSAFFVPLEDLIHYNNGFYNLRSRLVTTSTLNLETQNDKYKLKVVNGDVTFSVPMLVDGVLVSEYKVPNSEILLISFPDTINRLDELLSTDDNITLIYKVTPTGRRTPKYMVVHNKSTDYTHNSSLLSKYEKLLTSNKEDLKSFIFEQAYVNLTVKGEKLQLENKSALKNITKFEDKVIIL